MIMKKKRKIVMIILLLSILLVLILMGLFIEFNGRNTNNNEVEIVSSMIEIQKEKELEFNTKGYSIDAPNVILNPYGNSPLTALILFETKEKVSPTITIKGKDELSTFTHTFKSSKKHYLKVYGLYADYENEVFRNEDGTTRIRNLWDQTIPGNPPEGYVIGTEYTREEINEALDMAYALKDWASTVLTIHLVSFIGLFFRRKVK